MEQGFLTGFVVNSRISLSSAARMEHLYFHQRVAISFECTTYNVKLGHMDIDNSKHAKFVATVGLVVLKVGLFHFSPESFLL